MENILNGCWVIEYLPQKLRHCYGCSIGNIVQINPSRRKKNKHQQPFETSSINSSGDLL